MYSTVGLYHMPNTVHKTKHLSLLNQSLCCRKIVSDTALCNSSWWIQYTQSHELRKLGTSKAFSSTDRQEDYCSLRGWVVKFHGSKATLCLQYENSQSAITFYDPCDIK